ncbi:hypothetical protein [Pseudomonas gingeri]|uniref:Uncharacterized protein n=1 Tax=Pseudomonas gingeri TaxID=117681 RepID=A0A7Y7YCE6_9PSED|nr:hypothetical protein [Pseudomonas gingeri]NWB30394.1 hypothetical protein [Pseudomonas gingeri]NWC33763.1 hypothetical protein [Pseudomonas gingeri]NWD04410.1 hypothetical protein [Pseudomonas gingeri]NWE27729.1 hypothetical protein [Pseudomonas gingeri]NWE35241.1 hypothetical protein [Pseudomonas gingeri]
MGAGSISTAGTTQNTEWFNRSESIKRTELAAQLQVNQKNIKLLTRLVTEVSNVQNVKGGGYLRFNKENGGLYFSPNRSILETFRLRDGGASELPQYMKNFELGKFGKKIKCVTIQENLKNCLASHREHNNELVNSIIKIDVAEQNKLRSVSGRELHDDTLPPPDFNPPPPPVACKNSGASTGVKPIPKPRKRDMDRSLSAPPDNTTKAVDASQSKAILERSQSAPGKNSQAEAVEKMFDRSNSNPTADDSIDSEFDKLFYSDSTLIKMPAEDIEREFEEIFKNEQKTPDDQSAQPASLVKRSKSEAGTNSTPIRKMRKVDLLKNLNRTQSNPENSTTGITEGQVGQMKAFWESRSKPGSA